MTSSAAIGPVGPSKETEPSERWWEQYYVRYFVGTVIGGLIVFVLRDHSFLSAEFHALSTRLPESAWKDVAILGAGGLAFCYVASVPMLTLHAVRGAVTLEGRWIICLIWCLSVGFIVAVFLGPLAFKNMAIEAQTTLQHWIGVLVLAVVVISQLALLSRGHKQLAAIYSFYEKLVQQRRFIKDKGLDYIDSYRHLREHGNAVAIVLFEVAFGFILASMRTKTEIVFAVVIWLLPAAYTWILGSLLEKVMVEGKMSVQSAGP